MKGHSKSVCCMLLDPTNMRLFSGGLDGAVLVWDARVDPNTKFGVERTPILALRGHKKDKRITGLCYDSQNNILWSACEDGNIRTWDLNVIISLSYLI